MRATAMETHRHNREGGGSPIGLPPLPASFESQVGADGVRTVADEDAELVGAVALRRLCHDGGLRADAPPAEDQMRPNQSQSCWTA